MFADLIKKMLVVDPEKRITLKEIKAHPAFIEFLPPEYPLPTPLPLSSLKEPIDASMVDQTVLLILKAIGYASEEEIMKELQTDHQTMAKVFYKMAIKKMTLGLPEWPMSDSESDFTTIPIVSGDDPFLMSPIEISTAGNLDQTNDPFRRRKSVVSSIDFSIHSLAHPVGWSESDLVPPDRFIDDQLYTSIPISFPALVTLLVKLFSKLEVEWLYPDELTMLCRKSDKTLYMTIKIGYETTETICMQILLNRGQGQEFGIILQHIKATINDAIMEQEENIEQPSQIL